ncbi:unnamed protein product [Rotaria socialis]|uniref:CABIT domain-containing protein n=1 Tax=Rotaria socialis TaxID=392032 RepID=A0A818QFA5_9BILA|nr:unnamed protein product [Rotaria socialis]CAF3637902.1 unnamed protein product [Rotaria socialis]CAF4427350.1 unnamed protein product [Rotaria socialis]CAF4681410.1 unnamed protein product [Rotaria socialis]
MDRIRWSEKSMPFGSIVNNPNITKPVLVLIGNKPIVVGEKISGEFITASPCKVSGDRFDVLEQEIVLSSKHTGLWRVISRATTQKEGHIHRLTTKDIESVHKQDSLNKRDTPRSYISIREIEAFELIARSNSAAVASGKQIERRLKPIEENVEFEITDATEVEYTPSEGERTSQDYVTQPKTKQPLLLSLLLPGVVEHEQVIRNRVLRALHCVTKGETRKRHFLVEINELPCEIRPVASEGSAELRYIHSTQNLFDYILNHGNDTILYVKLLRGDPPMKAVEFDGYMVLKSIISGDKIPICRVEDLEITLVNPDLPVKVRLPPRGEYSWHDLPEVRAAEVQCVQLSLALFARHESEMYIATERQKSRKQSYSEPTYNQTLRTSNSHKSFNAVKKHREECEKVFGNNNSSSSSSYGTKTRTSAKDDRYTQQAPISNQTLFNGMVHRYDAVQPRECSSAQNKTHSVLPYHDRGKYSRTGTEHEKLDKRYDEQDSYDHIQRTTIEENPIHAKSNKNKSRTSANAKEEKISVYNKHQ